MSDSISVSRPIAASPEQVWALISDLPRMGEWSPENTGGSWLKGATEAAVGARFKGGNANGKKSWNTTVTVTVCEPGRKFVFDVSSGGFSVATWSYEIDPTATGCTVTETWTDARGRIVKPLSGAVSGVKDRAETNRAGMEATLAAVAAAAEGSTEIK